MEKPLGIPGGAKKVVDCLSIMLQMAAIYWTGKPENYWPIIAVAASVPIVYLLNDSATKSILHLTTVYLGYVKVDENILLIQIGLFALQTLAFGLSDDHIGTIGPIVACTNAITGRETVVGAAALAATDWLYRKHMAAASDLVHKSGHINGKDSVSGEPIQWNFPYNCHHNDSKELFTYIKTYENCEFADQGLLSDCKKIISGFDHMKHIKGLVSYAALAYSTLSFYTNHAGNVPITSAIIGKPDDDIVDDDPKKKPDPGPDPKPKPEPTPSRSKGYEIQSTQKLHVKDIVDNENKINEEIVAGINRAHNFYSKATSYITSSNRTFKGETLRLASSMVKELGTACKEIKVGQSITSELLKIMAPMEDMFSDVGKVSIMYYITAMEVLTSRVGYIQSMLDVERSKIPTAHFLVQAPTVARKIKDQVDKLGIGDFASPAPKAIMFIVQQFIAELSEELISEFVLNPHRQVQNFSNRAFPVLLGAYSMDTLIINNIINLLNSVEAQLEGLASSAAASIVDSDDVVAFRIVFE